MFKTSTSRLPADHFISGALFGGMSASALEFYTDKKYSTADSIKNISKFALQGGVATSLSISASNKLVRKNYLGASFDIAVGVGLILATEKVFKTQTKEI